MKLKHTQGPWMVTQPDDKGVFNIHKINLQLVDSIMIDTPETEANARLIAAAPELLDALQKVETLVQQYKVTPAAGHLTIIDAIIGLAIAKATGGA